MEDPPVLGGQMEIYGPRGQMKGVSDPHADCGRCKMGCRQRWGGGQAALRGEVTSTERGFPFNPCGLTISKG